MRKSRAEELRELPSLFRNYVSLAGAAIVVASLTSIILLFMLELVGGEDSPYVGILTYIVLPAVMLFGLTVIPVGMLWERHRRRTHAPSEIPAFPVLDLNDSQTRRRAATFVGITFFFVFISAFGSYRAYEYTESVAFCGTLCHTVMEPEYAAFRASSHARLRCVDCHVGPGADWYVRSKLSGAYQLYAVLANNYPRPIPTPVHNLRPARDTCEQCHWPDKFFGAQLKEFNHFGYDEANSLRQTRLLLKTGGGSPETGQAVGIHWHVNTTDEITYFSADEQREVIPYVRWKKADGTVVEFRREGVEITPEQMANAPRRRMDCVDCHNRPTHVYVPPARAVDEAMVGGRLDPSLPYLKREAVAVLARPYTTAEEALDSIDVTLDGFYSKNYPQVFAERRDAIDAAKVELRRIFQTYIFPEMKVTWRTHPDHVGHYYYQGCFRCHDGKHVSDTGKRIRNECAICHTTLDETYNGVTFTPPNGEYKHPVDLGDLPVYECSRCHIGDQPFKHPVDLGDISQFQCVACHPGGNH